MRLTPTRTGVNQQLNESALRACGEESDARQRAQRAEGYAAWGHRVERAQPRAILGKALSVST